MVLEFDKAKAAAKGEPLGVLHTRIAHDFYLRAHRRMSIMHGSHSNLSNSRGELRVGAEGGLAEHFLEVGLRDLLRQPTHR